MMANPTTTMYVSGQRELKRKLNALGKNFPKGKIRKAANKAVNLPLKQARKNAPKDTGALRKGIIKVEEKAWKARKKLKKAVFQIYFDNAKNSIFQKPLNPETQGSRGGQTRIPHAYYPVSMEYGFHVEVGKRSPGKHFISRAIEQTQSQTTKVLIDDLIDSIDKIARK
jgi:hypothetical protein